MPPGIGYNGQRQRKPQQPQPEPAVEAAPEPSVSVRQPNQRQNNVAQAISMERNMLGETEEAPQAPKPVIPRPQVRQTGERQRNFVQAMESIEEGVPEIVAPQPELGEGGGGGTEETPYELRQQNQATGAIGGAAAGIGGGMSGQHMAHRRNRYEGNQFLFDPNFMEEIIRAPGIGQRTVQRIQEHIRQHGPIRTREDLDRVRGIGPTTIRRLQHMVAFEGDVREGASPQDVREGDNSGELIAGGAIAAGILGSAAAAAAYGNRAQRIISGEIKPNAIDRQLIPLLYRGSRDEATRRFIESIGRDPGTQRDAFGRTFTPEGDLDQGMLFRNDPERIPQEHSLNELQRLQRRAMNLREGSGPRAIADSMTGNEGGDLAQEIREDIENLLQREDLSPQERMQAERLRENLTEVMRQRLEGRLATNDVPEFEARLRESRRYLNLSQEGRTRVEAELGALRAQAQAGEDTTRNIERINRAIQEDLMGINQIHPEGTQPEQPVDARQIPDASRVEIRDSRTGEVLTPEQARGRRVEIVRYNQATGEIIRTRQIMPELFGSEVPQFPPDKPGEAPPIEGEPPPRDPDRFEPGQNPRDPGATRPETTGAPIARTENPSDPSTQAPSQEGRPGEGTHIGTTEAERLRNRITTINRSIERARARGDHETVRQQERILQEVRDQRNQRQRGGGEEQVDPEVSQTEVRNRAAEERMNALFQEIAEIEAEGGAHAQDAIESKRREIERIRNTARTSETANPSQQPQRPQHPSDSNFGTPEPPSPTPQHESIGRGPEEPGRNPHVTPDSINPETRGPVRPGGGRVLPPNRSDLIRTNADDYIEQIRELRNQLERGIINEEQLAERMQEITNEVERRESNIETADSPEGFRRDIELQGRQQQGPRMLEIEGFIHPQPEHSPEDIRQQMWTEEEARQIDELERQRRAGEITEAEYQRRADALWEPGPQTRENLDELRRRNLIDEETYRAEIDNLDGGLAQRRRIEQSRRLVEGFERNLEEFRRRAVDDPRFVEDVEQQERMLEEERRKLAEAEERLRQIEEARIGRRDIRVTPTDVEAVEDTTPPREHTPEQERVLDNLDEQFRREQSFNEALVNEELPRQPDQRERRVNQIIERIENAEGINLRQRVRMRRLARNLRRIGGNLVVDTLVMEGLARMFSGGETGLIDIISEASPSERAEIIAGLFMPFMPEAHAYERTTEDLINTRMHETGQSRESAIEQLAAQPAASSNIPPDQMAALREEAAASRRRAVVLEEIREELGMPHANVDQIRSALENMQTAGRPSEESGASEEDFLTEQEGNRSSRARAHLFQGELHPDISYSYQDMLEAYRQAESEGITDQQRQIAAQRLTEKYEMDRAIASVQNIGTPAMRERIREQIEQRRTLGGSLITDSMSEEELAFTIAHMTPAERERERTQLEAIYRRGRQIGGEGMTLTRFLDAQINQGGLFTGGQQIFEENENPRAVRAPRRPFGPNPRTHGLIQRLR